MTVQDKTLEYSNGKGEDDVEEWNRKLNDLLFGLGRKVEAAKVSKCHFSRKLDNGTYQRFKPCGKRLCAVCLVRRKRKKLRDWEPKVLRMTGPVHITLTYHDVRYLSGIGEKMTAAFGRLRDGKALVNCVAGVYNLEYTYEGGLFHPHLHVLADIPGGVSEAAVSREWKALTGADHLPAFVVKVVPLAGPDAVRRTLGYLLKAPCPILNMNVVSETYGSFKKGYKFFRSFGAFRQGPQVSTAGSYILVEGG